MRTDEDLLSDLGFEATPANLLTVPIYVWACILTCAVGYYADKWGNRGYFNLYVVKYSFLTHRSIIFYH